MSDPAIHDLWLAQGDALRDWHENRNKPDIAVVLNTGAGKTLIGLLAAQSLVNESDGQVIYTCSNIQLVQQTADKASGYGLNVATYYRRKFYNEQQFRRGRVPCLTTYHALFNGRSRFASEDLTAVVFDDSHTAGQLLREQFTLRIQQATFPELYSRLSQLFRPYFARIGQEMGYIETIDGQDRFGSRFVPPFAVRQFFGEFQRELLAASLGNSDETTFAWAHVRNHVDLCTVFVSSNDISITPPMIPVDTLPYFRDGVRRLYLSATLSAKDEFLRVFGRVPEPMIAPPTAVGECERMILIPSLAKDSSRGVDDIATAKQVVASEKCLVLVPTYRRKHAWDNIASDFGADTSSQVERFKTATSPASLVLTARYDGVDLPGDSCRILVVDDLPTGLNPLERYLWDQLRLGKLLRSTIASRIVQSFGRISRGMSDHGVVLLTGNKLTEWILAPSNQALLPSFLQRQLSLGVELSEMLELKDFPDTASQCLDRNDSWIAYYQRIMDSTEALPAPTEDLDLALRMTKAEVAFGQALWQRDFAKAAKALETDLEPTFITSRPTGAWHALWLGYCYELLGDIDSAHELYGRAHSADRSIPAFDTASFETSDSVNLAPQAFAVAALLRRGNSVHLQLPRHFDRDLAALDGSGDVPHIESALESLGTFLGLQASRPDSELGTGPDVCWTVDNGPALSIEAKTAKGTRSTYSKRDLGQVSDHRQWVLDNHPSERVYSTFVGPIVPAGWDANPEPDVTIVPLAEFHALADRLKAAMTDICVAAIPITGATTVQQVFEKRGLLWPDVFVNMPKFALRDIPRPMQHVTDLPTAHTHSGKP